MLREDGRIEDKVTVTAKEGMAVVLRLGRRPSIGPSDRDVTIGPREWEHHIKGSTPKVSGLAEKLFLGSHLDQSNFLGSNSAKTRNSEATADISALKYLDVQHQVHEDGLEGSI